MPWPPKCTAKVVQCSVCGAENAHPGANGVHLCDACALDHPYWCKHCGKAYPSHVVHVCSNCNGLICIKCYELAKLTEGMTDESGFVGGGTSEVLDYEELPEVNTGKIAMIKYVVDHTGIGLAAAKEYVEGKTGLYPQIWKFTPMSGHAPLKTKLQAAFGSFPPEGKPGTGKTTFDYSELEQKVAGKLVKPKKLPKGFVTHTMSTKAQPLFHPDKSQQQVFAEWELEPMLDLTRAAADYYLLALMDSIQDKALAAVVKPLLNAHLMFMDTQFQRYLHMAVGGELRHARRHYNGPWTKFAPEIVGLFKNASMKGGRHDAWHVWKSFVETHGWEKTAGWAAQVFNAGHWPPSFGGKNWGNVAVTLHRRLKGEITPLVFVDTTLGLQHNTGCVFNKKVGWSYTGLQKVLDAGRQVDFDKAQPMQVLVDYASDVTTTLLEKVLEGYVKGEYSV